MQPADVGKWPAARAFASKHDIEGKLGSIASTQTN
jgi:hypothetical protein